MSRNLQETNNNVKIKLNGKPANRVKYAMWFSQMSKPISYSILNDINRLILTLQSLMCLVGCRCTISGLTLLKNSAAQLAGNKAGRRLPSSSLGMQEMGGGVINVRAHC